MMKTVPASLLLIMALTVPSLAQGICIIDEMRVQIIKGCVTDPNALPISGATIELFKNGAEVIAKVVTDENGCFSIREAAPGRYEIAASYPTFRTLYVPVRVARTSKAQKKQQEIVIVLDGLMDKPCGGGTAHLRSKAN
jgi:Carboxypeptidase regulatory-like domain